MDDEWKIRTIFNGLTVVTSSRVALNLHHKVWESTATKTSNKIIRNTQAKTSMSVNSYVNPICKDGICIVKLLWRSKERKHCKPWRYHNNDIMTLTLCTGPPERCTEVGQK